MHHSSEQYKQDVVSSLLVLAAGLIPKNKTTVAHCRTVSCIDMVEAYPVYIV